MTNFEKWKEGLTPETYAALVSGFQSEMSMNRVCKYCPLDATCDRDCAYGGCEEAILLWANAPAKEEE